MKEDFEKRIEELEQRYRFIADNLVDAIWVLDIETQTYDFITPSVERLSGYRAEEYEGVHLAQRLTPSSYERAVALFSKEKEAFEKGMERKLVLEVESLRKDGQPFWMEVTAKLFRDKHGHLKVAGVSKDITRRKSAEREREALIKDLGKALAEKEALLKEVRILRGLLPICSGCRRIRDSQGRWWPLDAYVEKHSEARITHTICPECTEVFYGKQKKTT